MRLEQAAQAPRLHAFPLSSQGRSRRWTDLDYLLAAAYAAALVAPAPFFWAPPFWVLALMSPTVGSL